MTNQPTDDIAQIYFDSVNKKPIGVGGIHSLSWQDYFIKQLEAYCTDQVIEELAKLKNHDNTIYDAHLGQVVSHNAIDKRIKELRN